MVTWSDTTRSLHDLTSQYLSNRYSSDWGLIFTLNDRITSGQLSVHIWMHLCHIWDLVSQTNLEVVLDTCGHILRAVSTQMCAGPHRTSTYISTIENLLLWRTNTRALSFFSGMHCCTVAMLSALPPSLDKNNTFGLVKKELLVIISDYLSRSRKVRSNHKWPLQMHVVINRLNPHIQSCPLMIA